MQMILASNDNITNPSKTIGIKEQIMNAVTQSPYILEMRNVSKTFPGVKALDGINLNVKRGSIHALMGENGAGKSTLMKVLYGIYTPDAGVNLF